MIELGKMFTSAFILGIILLGIFTLASSIQPVKAIGTVYIRGDGTIDPPSAPIQRNGDVYTLSGNISSDTSGIIIERNNIIVDGAGYIIQGTGGHIGISVAGRSNVTLTNARIQNYSTNIYIYNSANCVISNNSVVEMDEYGISISSSFSNVVSDNEIANRSTSGTGIGVGISVEYSTNTTVSRNQITEVNYGIRTISESTDNIVENVVINSNIGIYVGRAFNITISRNNLTGNLLKGISLADSSKNLVYGNNIEENMWGIEHESSWSGGYSSNNAIFENLIANNDYGVVLRKVYDNEYYHNSFFNNTIQVYDWSLQDPKWAPSENIWDHGYPSGGNYWSDYATVDFYQGPYQNLTGSDGLGDTSLNIDARNIDRYPLVNVVGLVPAYPVATFSYFPIYPIAGQTVVFNASDSSCPNGTVETYFWSFGDGVHGLGKVITHEYLSYGSYNVTLTAYSNTRHTGNLTQSIFIRGYPAASFFYLPTSNASVGQPVTLTHHHQIPKAERLRLTSGTLVMEIERLHLIQLSLTPSYKEKSTTLR